MRTGTTNVVEVLEQRGFLDNITSADIYKHVASQAVTYCGFDPTSESLQIGNLQSIMGLAHFQRAGHVALAVVGGATGRIGDPSGKTAERPLLSEEELDHNVEGLRENLSRFLDFDCKKAPAKLLDNIDWLRNFSYIDFLRDVGKYFRLGAMLGKETVRTRMESSTGISYAEFSYQVLQSYDFLHLYDSEQCRVQIGGSDQWGNITAGVELIRRMRSIEAYGLTFPLVCDSSGQKIGKSEENAVFLSAEKTSYYDFYQYFVRVVDADVIRFLKLFTFLELEEISEIEREEVEKKPEQRVAQKRLAAEVTRMVHGEEGLATAVGASEVMFGGAMDGLHADQLLQVFSEVPSVEISSNRLVNMTVIDVAVEAGLSKSKGEARRLIESGGLYVNNVRVNDMKTVVKSSVVIDGKLLILRSGKKKFYLVRVV